MSLKHDCEFEDFCNEDCIVEYYYDKIILIPDGDDMRKTLRDMVDYVYNEAYENGYYDG
jgi:hypothetical protein